MWNMERIGFTASEEKWFENVDGRTDAFLYYKLTYEPSAQMSLKRPGSEIKLVTAPDKCVGAVVSKLARS